MDDQYLLLILFLILASTESGLQCNLYTLDVYTDTGLAVNTITFFGDIVLQ